MLMSMVTTINETTLFPHKQVTQLLFSLAQQEVSPRTSGRLSHSSGPLNGTQSCGSLTDSPPVSPSEIDDIKVCVPPLSPFSTLQIAFKHYKFCGALSVWLMVFLGSPVATLHWLPESDIYLIRQPCFLLLFLTFLVRSTITGLAAHLEPSIIVQLSL